MSSPRSPVAVVGLLVIASLVAASYALVRPAFQSSDEVSYVAAAQEAARTDWASTPEDVVRLMPGGRLVSEWHSGKRAFTWTGGAVLMASLRRLSPPDALHASRLVFAVTHLIVVLCTWTMVRLLEPDRPATAHLAGLILALQPVVAATNATIAPDALANAASAVALLALVAGLRTGRWTALAGAVAGAVLAASCKDTTYGIVGAVCLGLLLAGVRARATASSGRATRWLALGGAVLLATLAVITLRASANVALASMRSVFDGREFSWLFDVVATAVSNLPSLVDSAWTSVLNFGGHDLLVPAVVTWPAWLLSGLTVLGALGTLRDENLARRGVAVVLAVGVLATLALAPVRQVLVGNVDALQGRWLFPAAPIMAWWLARSWTAPRSGQWVPIAVGLAAWMAVAPLAGVLVPQFYVDFPAEYAVDRLYLQGVYGRGADPALLLQYVTPVSAWVVTLRAEALAVTLAASLVLVVLVARAYAPRATRAASPGAR